MWNVALCARKHGGEGRPACCASRAWSAPGEQWRVVQLHLGFQACQADERLQRADLVHCTLGRHASHTS